jgi:4-amino-4-deoxy-L-arabinose transferase-like glycosyltransferase
MVLLLAGLYVPGGLRTAEMHSSLQSGALSIESIDPTMVIDLPYHVLQRLSFIVFGVSIISIKLPSLLLGALTIFGLFLLIRTWFRRNIAVITTILAVTAAPFLFIFQDGTPNIIYRFFSIWILFSATYVTRKKLFGTLWKVLTGVLMATALYTPLGVYLVIAVLTTAFFHPHIRYTIKKFSRPRLWIAIVLGIISLVPLVYASFVDRSTLFTLLGIPTRDPEIRHNIMLIFSTVTGFGSADSGYLLKPLYSIGFMLLILIGVYKLVTYKHTARSYVTLSLSVFLIPLVIFNPERVLYLLPLACLMLALGIATLVTDWYKLFPRNPYARVAGLIPLSIVVLGIAYSGIARYSNNYIYNPDILKHYSNDLRLVEREVSLTHGKQKPIVIVSKDDAGFYTMAASFNKNFVVADKLPTASAKIIISRDATVKPSADVEKIITSRFSDNADRFYVYNYSAK